MKKKTSRKRQAPAALAVAPGSAGFSPCCNVPVRVVGSDEGTHWHECSTCGNPCDPTPRDLGIPPDTIWLQWHGDGEPADGEPADRADITWCADRIWPGDVGPYIGPAEAARLRALVAIGQKIRDDMRYADDDKGLGAQWDALCEPNDEDQTRRANI